MKVFHATCLLAVLLEFLGAGCSKPAEETPPAAAPVAGDEQVASPEAPPAGGPAPALSLSANGSLHAEVCRGWPIVLEASLLHPGVLDEPEHVPLIILAARQGPWPRAVRIEVKSAQEVSTDWPVEPAGAPETTLTLDARTFGAAAWLVSPESSSQLAEGTYALTAVLDTREAILPGAWRGRVESAPASVRIAAEPSPLPRNLEDRKRALLIDYYGLEGDRTRAQAAADEWLARSPGNVGPLALKADLLADSGQKQAALELYNQAIEAWSKENLEAQEPPVELLRKRRALRNALVKE